MDCDLKQWMSFFSQNELLPILQYLDSEYSRGDNVLYPSRDNVFKAFKLCSPWDLKAVIVGDEPSCIKGESTGIAFGVRAGESPGPLLKIFKNSIVNAENNYIPYVDETLESWAKQGVLLINSSLTVEENNPKCHIDLWEPVMNSLFKSISERMFGIVFVLLGDYARKFERFIDSGKKHMVIKDEIPQYYIENGIDHKYMFFDAINIFINEWYKENIDWYGNEWGGFTSDKDKGYWGY